MLRCTGRAGRGTGDDGMARSVGSPGRALRGAWERLQRFPAGDRLFSWALGRMAPYSGSIGAVVRELSPGRARVELRDRSKVRTPLDSIHAVALMNPAALSTGLALNSA